MKKGDLFPLASGRQLRKTQDLRIQYTGEYRCPKKGEWFLFGAVVEGYPATLDGSCPYHIGRKVRVKVETIETVVEVVK